MTVKQRKQWKRQKRRKKGNRGRRDGKGWERYGGKENEDSVRVSGVRI